MGRRGAEKDAVERERARGGAPDEIGVCHEVYVTLLEYASCDAPEVPPWWRMNALIVESRLPSGKSTSPSVGQFSLSGQSSHAVL